MMTDSERALLERFVPMMQAEYRRIGVEAEVEAFFTGSGGVPTELNLEKELATLRAIPTNAGFEAYCAAFGIDVHWLRRTHDELMRQAPPNEEL